MRKEWMWGGVVLVAVLGGCATVGQLQEKQPYAVFATKKQPKALAECIRDGWQEQTFGGAPYPVAMQSTGEQFMVVSPNNGSPIELAVVAPESVKLYFAAGVFGSRKEKRQTAIAKCL